MRAYVLVALAVLTVGPAAVAQEGVWRFRWQAGQVLNYRLEHSATATVSGKAGRHDTTMKMKLLKRWQVLAVDEQGVATVQLSLASMRSEQTLPNGETMLFDSTAPDKSSEGLKEALQQYVGKPLAVLRIDGTGKVVEVKQGGTTDYEVEPPFTLTLPAGAVAAGGSWQRPYAVTLNPPAGTGEKYPAVQTYALKSVAGSLATVSLKTAFEAFQDVPGERVALMQKQPEGEIVFDVQNGRLHSARLRISQQVEDTGATYGLESTLTEEYVP